MWVKYAKILLLCSVLGSTNIPAGLCASLQANTTATGLQAAGQGAEDSGAPGVQLYSVTPAPTQQSAPSATTATTVIIATTARPGPALRLALLLPLRSETLGQAAEAVRSGFMAAFERDKNGARVSVIATGDAPQEILASYAAAVSNHDVVVGPLSRPGVAAIAESGAVTVPTIALNQAEAASDAREPAATTALPPGMLNIGLSIEDEARQVAQWAGAAAPASRVFILYGNAPWQRRAAKAFSAQWQRLGREPESLEMATGVGSTVSAASLALLKLRIGNEAPPLLFVALSAWQARQVRQAVGSEPLMYGTSQLNPYPLIDWATAERLPEMNGVRLIDLPWQLQADHPAVMAYPRPLVSPGQELSADMERLYALGIDAYRIASEINLQHGRFEIDGVTGRLVIGYGGNGATRFERLEQPAVYRNGAVSPWFGAP